MVFQQRPHTFSSDQSKVQYLLGLPRGRALAWAEAIFTSQPVGTWEYETFVSKMKAVFDHPDNHGSAFNHLLILRQGKGSVADYSVDFWTYVWTPSAETCLSLLTQTSHGDKIPAFWGFSCQNSCTSLRGRAHGDRASSADPRRAQAQIPGW